MELALIKVQTDSAERQSRPNQEALKRYLEAIILVSVLGTLTHTHTQLIFRSTEAESRDVQVPIGP